MYADIDLQPAAIIKGEELLCSGTRAEVLSWLSEQLSGCSFSYADPCYLYELDPDAQYFSNCREQIAEGYLPLVELPIICKAEIWREELSGLLAPDILAQLDSDWQIRRIGFKRWLVQAGYTGEAAYVKGSTVIWGEHRGGYLGSGSWYMLLPDDKGSYISEAGKVIRGTQGGKIL